MANRNAAAGTTEHLATGTLPHRALKVLAERLGRKAGTKIASSSLSDSIIGKITSKFGITVPDTVFEVSGDVGAIFLQDPIAWKAFVGAFGMSEDQAKELTNEGLDELIGGYMDRAREMKGKSGKELDDALASEADLTIDRMKNRVTANHPHLVLKVWYHKHLRVAHAVGCENLKWISRGVDKGQDEAGIPYAEVLSRGGRMTRECECSDDRLPKNGSLQEAMVQSPTHVREAFDRLLLTQNEAERSKILEAGRKRTDISPEDLAEVVESAEELRVEKLRALVGVQAPEAVKAPSRFKKFLDKLGERAVGIGEHLTAHPDDPNRVAWREQMDEETARMREETRRRRALWNKK